MLSVYKINLLNHSVVNQSPLNSLISFFLFWLNNALALCFLSLHSLQNSHLLSLPHFKHFIYSWLYGKFSHGIQSLSQSRFLCHIMYNISAFLLLSILSQLTSLLDRKNIFNVIDNHNILAIRIFKMVFIRCFKD